MFKWQSHSHARAIGLDLGHGAVRVLKMEDRGGEKPAVTVALRRELPQPINSKSYLQSAAHIAGEMLREAGAGNVMMTLPRELTQVRTLRVGVSDPAEVLEREASASFGFDLSAAEVRYLEAGEVRQNGEPRREVIAIAAEHRQIDAFLEMLHTAGIWPALLEIQPTSLMRVAENVIPDPVTALVDVGAHCTQIIVGRGSRICVLRSLEIGGERLSSIVAGRLGISQRDAALLRQRLDQSPRPENDSVGRAVHDAIRAAVEEIAAEVLRSVRYYSVSFRGGAPSRVLISGGGAQCRQIRDCIAATTNLPVLPMTLADRFDLGGVDLVKQDPAETAQWALAAGLALRGIVPKNPQDPSSQPKPGPDMADARVEATVNA